MRPTVLDILLRFFAAPRQPKLRRDLVAALVEGLALEAAAADATIEQLMADDFLCAMQVHFYDPEVETLVQAHGVRPAVRLDRDLGSGRWPSPVPR